MHKVDNAEFDVQNVIFTNSSNDPLNNYLTMNITDFSYEIL